MIEFGTAETWIWDGERMAVRFQIVAYGKPVNCFVSRECIDDHMGNPRTDADRLDAAKMLFDTVTDNIRELVSLGRFEEDGSLILRTADW